MTKLKKRIEQKPIVATAPCRIDMGGTVDLPVFHYTLHHLSPMTFNIALDLRTKVTISPYEQGKIKISSKGFESAEFGIDSVPFDHPFGLMFAIAAYFRVDGIQIEIDSASPPKSGMGGSSTAAVALIAALSNGLETNLSKPKIVNLAYALESNVAGGPCGAQDHLAAAFGGVNAWYWSAIPGENRFKQVTLVKDYKEFQKHLLIAYCGVTHESMQTNLKWVKQFMSGITRQQWSQIVIHTRDFVKAVQLSQWDDAVNCMKREVEIRKLMTPEVFDDFGTRLADAASQNACGARFTGAGSGGSIWAIGDIGNIERLKLIWESMLRSREGALLLDSNIADTGIKIES